MWIVASFTRDGAPATGLSPTVVVRDVDTSAVVISSASMSETGDGFYSYDFSAYNPLRDYAVVCDSVTLSGVERYSYASSGEYNEVLDSIDATMGVVDLRSLLLRKIHTNRLELMDGDTDNWVLYDDDETTPLLTFDVSDKDGNVIVQCPNTPAIRSGAEGTISGSYTPDIYMRKAVYDPDDDGCVVCAENVSDGIYTSTASGVAYAVDNSHLPCILGTKCINESAIGDQLVVKYDAATDRLVYGLPGISGTASGIISHNWLLELDGDDHLQYVPRTGIRGFTSTVSGVDPTEDYHLTTRQYVDDQIAVLSGATDEHSELQGLAGDDHIFYVPTDGSRGFTNTVSGIFPIQPSDLVTKAYIDQLVGDVKQGVVSLSNGDTDTSVVFAAPFVDDSYAIIVHVENSVDDLYSQYMYSMVDTTASGFTIEYSDFIDTDNYKLHWYAVRAGGVAGQVVNHSGLNQLDEDDHTQYIRVDGFRAFTSTIAGVDPTEDTHLVTRGYLTTQLSGAIISGVGVTDHGALTGLTDDDHTQYSMVDGTRAFTSTVGGITPVADTDLTTKAYVDANAGASNLDGGVADTNYGGTTSLDGGDATSF